MSENQSAEPSAPAENNESVDSQEINQEGAEQQADAPAKIEVPITKQEIKKLRKLKLKVDGRELEEELPFEIDDNPEAVEYMTRQLQMSKMASKRAQDASELEKEVKNFINELRKNPKKILMDPSIGIDIKQLAASIIEEEIANSQKTPEQLEREKLQNELKALRDEREREKEDFLKKESERLTEQAYQSYDLQISKALENSELPKSPYIVKKIADYMLSGLNEGLDVTVDDVLPLVKEEMQNDLKEMFAMMPDEVVERLVGKDKITSIRKRNLAKAKASPPIPVSKAIQDTGKKAEQEKETAKKMTYKDFFKV